MTNDLNVKTLNSERDISMKTGDTTGLQTLLSSSILVAFFLVYEYLCEIIMSVHKKKKIKY